MLMRLFICSTYYHVYITLVKQLVYSNNVCTDLVICDDLPYGEQLADRIRSEGLFCNVWYVQQNQLPQVRSQNLIDAVFFKHKRRANTLRSLLPFSIRDYKDIYIYHDGTPLGTYLNDEKCRYHLLEDSLNFFQYVYQSSQASLMYPHDFIYFARRILNVGYFPLGYSPYLVDIEVNDRRNLQIKSSKIIERPRQEMEKMLTHAKIATLFKIFGYDSPVLPAERNAIVLTEPLYQDHICQTPEEQHAIYEKITNYLLNNGFCVYLKPHPRDVFDYTAYPVKLIDRYFPSEMFKLQGTNVFDCAVAVASSSLSTFPAKKKYHWDRQNQMPSPGL